MFLYYLGWNALYPLFCVMLICFSSVKAAAANISLSGKINCSFTQPDRDQDVGKGTTILVQEKPVFFLLRPYFMLEKLKLLYLLQRLVQSEKDAQRKASFPNQFICHTAESDHERPKQNTTENQVFPMSSKVKNGTTAIF